METWHRFHRLRREKLYWRPSQGASNSPGKPQNEFKCVSPLCVGGESPL